jgi:hypothetical protein
MFPLIFKSNMLKFNYSSAAIIFLQRGLLNPFLPTRNNFFGQKKWNFPAGTLLQDSFHCRYFRNHALLTLAQEHIYSTNTQVDIYSCTMSDGKSAQSESSKSTDCLDSEPSQQDFDASILGSILPSDASHLGSISCPLSISEEFSETSEVAPSYRQDKLTHKIN